MGQGSLAAQHEGIGMSQPSISIPYNVNVVMHHQAGAHGGVMMNHSGVTISQMPVGTGITNQGMQQHMVAPHQAMHHVHLPVGQSMQGTWTHFPINQQQQVLSQQGMVAQHQFVQQTINADGLNVANQHQQQVDPFANYHQQVDPFDMLVSRRGNIPPAPPQQQM
jgi:hypothetical protein